jgi:hypothetical protein
VPERLQGRVFGVADGFMSWGFAVAFISGAALTELAGARGLMLLTGVGEVSLALVAVAALRQHWRSDLAVGSPRTSWTEESLRVRDGSLGYHPGEQGPHLVGGHDFWLTLLDDLGKSGDDSRVELRPGVLG